MKHLFLLFCLIGCIAACNARGPSNFFSFNQNDEVTIIASVGSEELIQASVANYLSATDGQQFEVSVLPQRTAKVEITGELELKLGEIKPPNLTYFSYTAKGLNGLEYSGRNSLTAIQGGVQIKGCGCASFLTSLSGDISVIAFQRQKMMLLKSNFKEFAPTIVLLANLEANESDMTGKNNQQT